MSGTLFNYSEGQRLKKVGMEAAATSFSWAENPVAIAKGVAIMLAKRNGKVTADDVTEWMFNGSPETKRAIELIRDKPNSFGTAFKSPRLKYTGEHVISLRPERHGAEIRVWYYAGEQHE